MAGSTLFNEDTYSTLKISRSLPRKWWHNLRITYKDAGGVATTTVYVDGTFQRTASTPVAQTYTSPWVLTLGNFDGDIDEVRISNIDRGPLN